MGSTTAESLIPKFELTRLLNQDPAGSRISLLGTIDAQPALLIVDRSAFPTNEKYLKLFSKSVINIEDIGANDIYFWFLASQSTEGGQPPSLKINLIYPCTEEHIKKHSAQGRRMVTETAEIYAKYVKPYMQQKREQGRLNWVFNIIEGRTEQEDIMYREHGEEGFLMLPDLNWDRKTIASLHLLGVVERRDIWSVRDLKKSHITWIKHMREKIMDSTVKLYPELEKDQLKLYIHYQPTYYHFHIHIVHVQLEAGLTQATGKALGLENIISQLETLQGDDNAGMADVDLTYHLGEASELWEKIYLPLKEGRAVEGFAA